MRWLALDTEGGDVGWVVVGVVDREEGRVAVVEVGADVEGPVPHAASIPATAASTRPNRTRLVGLDRDGINDPLTVFRIARRPFARLGTASSPVAPSSPAADDPGGDDDGQHGQHDGDELRGVPVGHDQLGGGLVPDRCTVEASGTTPPSTFSL